MSQNKKLNFQPGQSLCLVFQTKTEQQNGAGAFFRAGLAQGRRIVFLVSDPQKFNPLDYLETDSRNEKSNGHPVPLHIRKIEDVFTSINLVEEKISIWLEAETARARSEGFTGLCLAVEMSWAVKSSPHELSRFENYLNEGLKGSSGQVLTLYSREVFSPDQIMQVLTVHPLVMVGGEITHNPYHIPCSKPAAETALQTWLDHLQEPTRSNGQIPESGKRLELIMASMPVVVFAINGQGVFTLSEGKSLAALGLKAGEVVGLNAIEVFSDLEELPSMLNRAMLGETFSVDISLNGSIFETHCSPLQNQEGEIDGMLGVAVDITDRRQAEDALRASEERYRLLVENQGEGAGVFGPEGQVIYINSAAEVILGVPVADLLGKNIGEFVPPDQKPVFAREIASRKTGQSATYEIAFLRKDGRRRQVLVTATPRYDAEGNYLGSFSIFRDITDRKKMEDRLRYQSNHDSLTGLYNRFYFDEVLDEYNRNRNLPVGVVVVDVDGLKQINDQNGHLTGDDHLRRVARLMRSSFRSEDIVARIGGDEFAVILPNCDQKVLDLSILRLRKNLAEVNQRAQDFPLEISIGGAILEPGQSLMRAFDLADQRMYLEKFARKRNN